MYSNRYSSSGFKRFTVGHELGHYFLEGHPQGSGANSDRGPAGRRGAVLLTLTQPALHSRS
jgi:hypothetical protein